MSTEMANRRLAIHSKITEWKMKKKKAKHELK